jgi:hypothetical protein
VRIKYLKTVPAVEGFGLGKNNLCMDRGLGLGEKLSHGSRQRSRKGRYALSFAAAPSMKRESTDGHRYVLCLLVLEVLVIAVALAAQIAA